MKLTWYGHSCFMIESRAGRVVFDPYADGSVPGLTLKPLTADLVLCSHGHADHAGEDKVTLTGEQTDYTVETLGCWHDDANGQKRGENLIRIVSGGGARVCHLGDVGHMLSKGQIKAIGHVDALLIPVGGFYTIDAATARELADAIDAQLVIPMHYRGEGFGYDVIETVQPFLDLTKNVEFVDGSSIELPDFGAPRTVVLKF
ncbi:MAG TPA: MBL fold metallo-hydrolase [Candidatus Scatomorpha pullistercoris]|uniref:MBL fold metallo-hydrolase n=1 Tax=Candidatus Scatomorpha pullistercoris TaxID=2840929 RepID=A0A9D1K956_9FIRM|nr:MBL fold metallo-hydrolase [Candidatus Scatomorpha pullistercoris]